MGNLFSSQCCPEREVLYTSENLYSNINSRNTSFYQRTSKTPEDKIKQVILEKHTDAEIAMSPGLKRPYIRRTLTKIPLNLCEIEKKDTEIINKRENSIATDSAEGNTYRKSYRQKTSIVNDPKTSFLSRAKEKMQRQRSFEDFSVKFDTSPRFNRTGLFCSFHHEIDNNYISKPNGDLDSDINLS